MRKTFIFSVCSLLACSATNVWAYPDFSTQIVQQQQACRGVVKDAAGETIIGATVQVKGTKNGTVTSVDGSFSLNNVSKGSVLLVSYVGYNSVEVVWSGSDLTITMKENAQSLEEVVVTGYGGHQKRATLTTAISKMDNKVLANGAFSNAGQALQGSVTGLRVVNTSGQPGTSPQIVLRGGATITGSNNSALVIVDGIIRNSMADVNPEDIESIQVLKDAGATAIYGARANGGVILVETKKGKKGTASVTYNFKVGQNHARRGYDFLNARDYIWYNRYGIKNTNNAVSAYSNGYRVDTQQGYGVGNKLFDVRYLTDETASLVNEGWQTMDDPYYEGKKLLYRDYSGLLQDAVFDANSATSEHYLSISGGNDRSTFAASTGYYSEDGQVRSTGFRRFTGTLNASYKVLPILTVNGGAQFLWSKTPTFYTGMYELFYRTRSQRPTWNPYMEDGSPASGFGSADGNPLYWIPKYTSKNSTTRYTFNAGFSLDIIKDHLTLNGNVSNLNYEYQYESFNKATKQQNQGSVNTRRGSSVEIEKYHQVQLNSTLNYRNTFNDVHNLDLMVGGEYYTYDYFDMNGSAHGSPTDDIATMNVASEYDNVSTEKSAYRILSSFGRAEYNYKMRYLLSLTGRYDGISRLKDNRWGFFPGMSVGWNVTEEDFWKDLPMSATVSTLKPRVSYGTNGNVNGIGNYTVYGSYGSGGLSKYNNSTSIINTGLVNTGLKWEKSKTFEVGLDIGLWHNKIYLILDYYNRRTQDLLTSQALPGYTGFSSITTNLGNLQNSGLEAEIRANILKKKDFNWDVTANITSVANKILKLPFNNVANNRVGGYEVAAGQAVADGNGGWKYTTKWVGGRQEGGKLGDIIAYKQNHIFRDWDDVKTHANNRVDEVGKLYGPGLESQYKGKEGWKPIEPGDVCWEDMDGDGKITSYDQKVIGNVFPKVTGGFSSTMSYKGFSFYARFDYALGHTIYNELLARSLGQYQGSFNIISKVKDTWTETNTNADLPKFYYADQLAKYNITRANGAGIALNGNNSRFYEKADYLACRELTLRYTLPKALIQKAYLQNASVYVTGQNLFYITGYSGSSPEPVVTSGYEGIDYARYPTPRTVLLGVSLTF